MKKDSVWMKKYKDEEKYFECEERLKEIYFGLSAVLRAMRNIPKDEFKEKETEKAYGYAVESLSCIDKLFKQKFKVSLWDETPEFKGV
jgi:ribosomal protein L34E